MACFCVFAGAASGTHPNFETEVRELATALSAQGHSFIYGGGATGLMGSFSDAVIDANGQITGVIPHFLDEKEVGNTRLTTLIQTETMHERKAEMYAQADGFILLPGGLGSMDETMEVLTWLQLGLLKAPFYILNVNEYWQPLQTLFDHIIKNGFMHTRPLDYLCWAQNAGALAALIAEANERRKPA